jgi:hypothetical protein
VLAEDPAALAQLVTDGVDVCRIASQEQPPGPGAKGIRILLEPLRGIGLRIDADRIEEDVATPMLSPSFACSSASRAVARGQMSLQVVKRKLMTKILSLIRSS